uniref:Uncharacterized protein n=1 Tax=Arundo donax TaxID=35708 RepID=A0A0A9H9D9_ARUDO
MIFKRYDMSCILNYRAIWFMQPFSA